MIEVTHGYSKDHRPDLKQVMMSLTMTGSANLPIWMEPLSGNSSDKTSFHETISRVRRFQKELKACDDFFWIADSALYSADKLLACPDVHWLRRVPENIKECGKLVSLPPQEVTWIEVDNGTYGGIRQRWLLVFSQQAYKREKKTLMKRIEKEKTEFSKACWHLSNQLFGCPKDAEKHVAQLHKEYRYHRIKYTIEPVEKYECHGRPNPLTPKVLQGYRVNYIILENEDTITSTLTKKGTLRTRNKSVKSRRVAV